MAEVINDVACTVCGCVCDDLRITVEGGRIVQVERACSLAEPWLLGQGSCEPSVATIAGEPATLEEGLNQAAEILTNARSPLIYGLSRSSTEGQRAAVRLADQLGATIDTTASLCHAPSIMALQQVGESTCTLGEIRNRADLILYWGSNPVASHPRHLERYSAESCGQFVPGGRGERTLVVVDIEPTATTERADIFLQVAPGRDFEVFCALRALIAGLPIEREEIAGVPLAQLRNLAERMKACRCGVIFFGLGLARQGFAHATVEALLRLVRDLNRHARFHARRMRVPGDVAGADNVLCWQTGFPFSVNLARGYPRYSPGEYSADAMLSRGEADACLFVGSEGIAPLSAAAKAHLNRIPTIVLDYPTVETPLAAAVRFTTAVYGIHRPGTAYRMDEVPIPLRQVLSTAYPSDGEVLRALVERVPRRLVDACSRLA